MARNDLEREQAGEFVAFCRAAELHWIVRKMSRLFEMARSTILTRKIERRAIRIERLA
jgi:hypothetical protein